MLYCYYPGKTNRIILEIKAQICIINQIATNYYNMLSV